MATYNWEVYLTDTWVDVGVNTLVFSSDPSNPGVAINVDEFNQGTHLGSDDPGSDQCGTTHIYNLRYADTNNYFGGSSTTSESITDTHLTLTEATVRVKFTDSSSITVSTGYFFCFDGVTETVEAVGVRAFAVQAGVGASSWTEINNDASGIGGNNSGERLTLTNYTGASTYHYYYFGLSVSPQSYGPKTQFDFGIALTYS